MNKLNKLLYLLGKNKNIITYIFNGKFIPNDPNINNPRFYNQKNLLFGCTYNSGKFSIIISCLYEINFYPNKLIEMYLEFDSKPKIDKSFTFYKFMYELYKVNYSNNRSKNFTSNNWTALNNPTI